MATEGDVEGTLVVKYDVTETAIAELRDRYKDIKFDTPAAYEEGRKAIAVLRDLRGKIEKRRKDLKADSLAFGRKVDAVARTFTTLIAEIEDPMQAAKTLIDEEESRKKREAEKAELLALEAKLKAEREEEEAKAKAARAEEEKRLAAQRAAIAEAEAKLAEDSRAAEIKRVAAEEELRVEREALARKTAQIEEIERAQRRQQEQQAAASRAEEDAKRSAAAAVEEAARLEALRPDIEKVHRYGATIEALADGSSVIDVEDGNARAALDWAAGRLRKIAEGLASFKGKA